MLCPPQFIFWYGGRGIPLDLDGGSGEGKRRGYFIEFR
ncbi:hypothetical protein CYA_0921 [Synechococcus sp. JA-3-3Ab]|nr:hypothetical protein CYA_0921 [Synechococcus sp. JA-3-3Ab]